jgi:hypothetical protein
VCHTAELDEKFCDVIVKRAIEQFGSTDDVFLLRGNEKIAYSEVAVDE